MAIAVILCLFAALYPPFAYAPTGDDTKVFRLVFEASILFFLAISVWRTRADLYLTVFGMLLLYLANWYASGELIDNVLSYFNKLALLLFLPVVLQRHRNLLLAMADLWVKFWTYSAIAGIIGYVLMFTNFVAPGASYLSRSAYEYFNYPLIGNFMLKQGLPRFTGWLTEPVIIALFFGFNILVAAKLVAVRKKRRRFVLLNLIGGLLTLSYAFAGFVVLMGLLRIKPVKRFLTNRITISVLVGVGLMTLYALLAWMLNNSQALLPYSSLGERVGGVIRAIDFISTQSLTQWLLGSGIEPFHFGLQGGTSTGLLVVLGSRGIIIFGIWLYWLRRFAKPVRGLFAYCVFYSLVLDFWHFPLFIFGLSIVYATDWWQRRLPTPSPVGVRSVA